MKNSLTSCLIYIRSLSTNYSEAQSIKLISCWVSGSFPLVVNTSQHFINFSKKATQLKLQTYWLNEKRPLVKRKADGVFTLATSHLWNSSFSPHKLKNLYIKTRHWNQEHTTTRQRYSQRITYQQQNPQTYHRITSNHKASTKTCFKVVRKELPRPDSAWSSPEHPAEGTPH